MAIDRFSLDDTDDTDYFALEVEFIEDDVIMFSVIDKTVRDNKERAVISVVYSDLVSGIAQLRRPTKRAPDTATPTETGEAS
jgi:hypothetical protein